MSLNKRLINTGGGALDYGIDGKYILTITAENTPNIYLSSDYGTTFSNFDLPSPSTDNNGTWHSTISKDGQYMYISLPGYGWFWRSSNYGVSWTKTTNTFYNVLKCDGTGQYVYTLKSNKVYRSSNYGASFSAISNTTSMYGGDQSISVNYDGSFVSVYYSNINLYSTDYGVNWTNRTISTNSITQGVCDSTGQYILGTSGSYNPTPSIRYSTDYGASFTSVYNSSYMGYCGMTNDQQNFFVMSDVLNPVKSLGNINNWTTWTGMAARRDSMDMGYSLNTVVREGDNYLRIENSFRPAFNYTIAPEIRSLSVNKYLD